MTVYVVQEVPGRNVLGARQYGDLKVLLPSNINIILSPAPTIGLACVLASENNRGKYSILKWDRIEKDYYPVSIDIHQKGEDYE